MIEHGAFEQDLTSPPNSLDTAAGESDGLTVVLRSHRVASFSNATPAIWAIVGGSRPDRVQGPTA
jgi:hypothetical protein